MLGSIEYPSYNREEKTTMTRDRLDIDQAIKLLHDFNQTQEPNLFKVVEATLANYEEKKKIRVECTRCNRWFYLVPTSGNIVSSLNERMKSEKHSTTTDEASRDTIVLRSRTVGRSKKPTNDKSQQILNKFLILSLQSPLHGVSTSSQASILGVLITQVLIYFEFEFSHYFICYYLLVAVSRSFFNVFFHLILGQLAA